MKQFDAYTKQQLDRITEAVFVMRAELDWSQRRLARESGVHFQTITRCELRGAYYSIPSLLKISKALGITLAVLIERAEL